MAILTDITKFFFVFLKFKENFEAPK